MDTIKKNTAKNALETLLVRSKRGLASLDTGKAKIAQWLNLSLSEVNDIIEEIEQPKRRRKCFPRK